MNDWFDRELQMLNEQMIQQACATLSKSEKGWQSLIDLYAFLDRGAALDQSGQEAVLVLISNCFGGHAGTALDAMRTQIAINEGAPRVLNGICCRCNRPIHPAERFCKHCI